MSQRSLRAALFAVAALSPIAAHAVPITYTYSGIASGTLGATPINSGEFLITFVADTNNILSLGTAVYQPFTENPSFPSPANPLPTFSWGGFSGTFTEPVSGTYIVALNSDGVAATLFNGYSGNPMFAFTDPAFNGYNLISPFSFFGVPELSLVPSTFPTDADDLIFTEVEDEVAFNAVGGIVVPESSTFALALPALGMVGTVIIKRRKK